MQTAQPYQLDFQYRGRRISVITAPILCGSGWGWAALIDERAPMEHRGRSFDAPGEALADAEAHTKAYIDSFDD